MLQCKESWLFDLFQSEFNWNQCFLEIKDYWLDLNGSVYWECACKVVCDKEQIKNADTLLFDGQNKVFAKLSKLVFL